MRKTITSFALTVVMALAFGQAQPTTQTTTQTTAPAVVVQTSASPIQDFVKNNNVSWEDAAASIALARDLNMDPQAILTQKSGIQNVSMYQLAPAFVIQQQTGKNLSDIYGMYSGGQTWLQIANGQNVPASLYNPNNVDTSAWTNDDFTKATWQAILMKNYGMTVDDAVYFGNTKNQMNEVIVGQIVSREDNTPIRDVMSAYANNQDWGSIDQQFAMNRQNPPNQSQNAVVVTNPPAQVVTVAPVVTQPAPVAAAPQPATTDATPPVTTGDPDPGATTTETTTTTSHMAVQSSSASPIEEWQIGGADINPYNGWADVTTTTTTYTLHRHHKHHVRRRRHHTRK
ncbi:MAG TPA: hypothetical protein VGL56_06220 [Fimbriimonadaceae bacterium]